MLHNYISKLKYNVLTKQLEIKAELMWNVHLFLVYVVVYTQMKSVRNTARIYIETKHKL